LGGIIRDGVALISTPVLGYTSVYALEMLLLLLTLWAMGPLMRRPLSAPRTCV
jgi:BCD family chlorophyll transporter-like MFS transporter